MVHQKRKKEESERFNYASSSQICLKSVKKELFIQIDSLIILLKFYYIFTSVDYLLLGILRLSFKYLFMYFRKYYYITFSKNSRSVSKFSNVPPKTII